MCRIDNKPVQFDSRNQQVQSFANCGVDPLKDSCDYISYTDLSTLKSDDKDFRVLQLNIHGLISKQQSLSHLVNSCTKNQQGSQLASCRAVFCAGFHVVTSTTHGVHMDTTWHPCGNPVGSCRNHIVSTFETLCCPPGNHIVSTWKPNGVHLETTWCAHETT